MFSHPFYQDVLIKAYDYSKPADEWMFGCFTNNLPPDHMTLLMLKMIRCLDVFAPDQNRCFA